MIKKHQLGVTLIEMMIVVVIFGLMSAIAVPSMQRMQSDQRLRTAVRSVADSFMLARAHAIRTGSNVIVIFQNSSGSSSPAGLTSTNVIDIIVDGPAATADCSIAANEVVWTMAPDTVARSLNWGTSPGLAGNTSVPTDAGFGPSNVRNGSSFTDATVTSTTADNSKFANWVVFQPDGLPRLMTPGACGALGPAGQGGGAIYLSNGRRDYAAVLSALGTVRVHIWMGAAWSE